jgi:PleD family two-component response regulator
MENGIERKQRINDAYTSSRSEDWQELRRAEAAADRTDGLGGVMNRRWFAYFEVYQRNRSTT